MMNFILDAIQNSGSEIIAALVPALAAAFFASGWWKSRAAWLKTLVEALANGAVKQTESNYVVPTKVANKSEKLTGVQQEIAKDIASSSVKSALLEVGVTALSAAGPIISNAVEKAVADMKKTVPMETQKLFP